MHSFWTARLRWQVQFEVQKNSNFCRQSSEKLQRRRVSWKNWHSLWKNHTALVWGWKTDISMRIHVQKSPRGWVWGGKSEFTWAIMHKKTTQGKFEVEKCTFPWAIRHRKIKGLKWLFPGQSVMHRKGTSAQIEVEKLASPWPVMHRIVTEALVEVEKR